MGTSVSRKGKASHSRFHLSSEGNFLGGPVVKNPPCNVQGAGCGEALVEEQRSHMLNNLACTPPTTDLSCSGAHAP